jgi:hypothetical protein
VIDSAPARRTARFLALAALSISFGCADRLPDQDLRILQAVPVAKLSTDILWKEYQTDKRVADRKYWGKAVEVTGKATEVLQEAPMPRIMFGQAPKAGSAGVEARLLEEQAAQALATAAVGQRITVRCFCEGLAGNVVLKSCIRR